MLLQGRQPCLSIRIPETFDTNDLKDLLKERQALDALADIGVDVCGNWPGENGRCPFHWIRVIYVSCGQYC